MPAAGLLVIAGYVGLIMALGSLYTALAIVLNDAYGRTVAPVEENTGKESWRIKEKTAR